MTGSDYGAMLEASPDKAYQALFDEYCNYVYTVVFSKLRSCGSREDIEECVSDIFAEIFKKYNGGSGDMKPFIATVAKRRAINVYRRLSARAEEVPLDDNEDYGAQADGGDDREQLTRCIKALGEPDSVIVIQKYYYRRTSAEIAESLGMKPSAVRMRCSRAVERLRVLLADCGITG